MSNDAVHDYVRTTFAPDAGRIPGDYDLVSAGIIDSLALVRLLAWVGETFSIPVEEIDLDPSEFRTVDQVSRFVDLHSPVATR